MDNNLNIFLKLISKKGYPNPKIDQVADAVDYPLDYFLEDFYQKYGIEKTTEFINKGLEKLLGPNLSYRMDLSEIYNSPSYAVFSISPYEYDPDEFQDGIQADLEVLDSKFIINGVEKTWEDIESEVDFSDWNDWSEFKDNIFNDISYHVRHNLGYWLYK